MAHRSLSIASILLIASLGSHGVVLAQTPAPRRPFATNLEIAREKLIERGYSPGPKTETMTPELQRALMLFQQAQGIPPTGRLDLATMGALGVSAETSSENSGYERRLSPATRTQLAQARVELDLAARAIPGGKLDGIEHHLETARHLLELDNYHGGRERVMTAKRQVDLALASIEEKRAQDARHHLELARLELGGILSYAPEATTAELEHQRNPRPETTHVPYWGNLEGAEEDSRFMAEMAEKRKQEAGEVSKPGKPCVGCNQTTNSGEWMKGASESGAEN